VTLSNGLHQENQIPLESTFFSLDPLIRPSSGFQVLIKRTACPLDAHLKSLVQVAQDAFVCLKHTFRPLLSLFRSTHLMALVKNERLMIKVPFKYLKN
jgi:hypothetical protein